MTEPDTENPKAVNNKPKKRYLPENRRKYYLRDVEKKREKQREYYAKNREQMINKVKENNYKKSGGKNPHGRPLKYPSATYIEDETVAQIEQASSCSEHGPLMIDSNSESWSDNPEICSLDQPRSDG